MRKAKGKRGEDGKRVGPNKRKRVRAGTRRRAKRDDVVCACDVTRNCREQLETRGCSGVRHVDPNPGSKRISEILEVFQVLETSEVKAKLESETVAADVVTISIYASQSYIESDNAGRCRDRDRGRTLLLDRATFPINLPVAI